MTHSVMRAKARSFQGGTDVRLRKGYSSRIASGIRMGGSVIFTFSTLRSRLHMEEFLSWTRYSFINSKSFDIVRNFGSISNSY